MFYDDNGDFSFKELSKWILGVFGLILFIGILNNYHKIIGFIDRLFDSLLG